MTNRALFLDRDGVINIDSGYCHRKEKFIFTSGIFELARNAYANRYKIVVITNQAGIGRGYYSEQQFFELTEWMSQRFLIENAPIEKVYFSPNHPLEGKGIYKKDDYMRKPNPGMIYQARKELNLNLDRSILIGDKETDMQAGISAGVGVNLLYSDKATFDPANSSFATITDLCQALSYLEKSTYHI